MTVRLIAGVVLGMGIGAVLFFDGGREVQRLVGLQPRSAYERVLDGMMIEKHKQTVKEVANANL